MVHALLEMGFEKTDPEQGVFFLKSKEVECLLALYVDDLIIAVHPPPSTQISSCFTLPGPRSMILVEPWVSFLG